MKLGRRCRQQAVGSLHRDGSARLVGDDAARRVDYLDDTHDVVRGQPVFKNNVDMAGRQECIIVAIAAIGACGRGGAQPVEGIEAVRFQRSGEVVAIRARDSAVTLLVRIGARFIVAAPPTAT